MNHDVFKGTFVDNYPNGHGELHYAQTENTYIGDFYNGVPHGTGSLMDHQGKLLYEGPWVEGQQHLPETIIYPNGDVYVGYLDDFGLPTGEGKRFLPSIHLIFSISM